MRAARAGLVLPFLFALLGLASTASARGTSVCAENVLRDWHNGRIGTNYAPACYRTAIANLPEDMRVYSSAQADIEGALQARLTALAQARKARSRVTSARSQVTSNETRKPVTRALADRKSARSRHPARAADPHTAQAALGPASDTTLPLPVLVAAGFALVLVSLASVSRVARKLRH
jgi:ParB-like chromosome segregation protein Spo0J